MPDKVPMVTSCPLCLAADEVQSMVTFQIDRVIAGGRTAIMICRSCAGAVIEAARKVDPPLLGWETVDLTGNLDSPVVDESVLACPLHPFSEAMTETQAESAELHDGEESEAGRWEATCPHGYAVSNCPEGCADGTSTH